MRRLGVKSDIHVLERKERAQLRFLDQSYAEFQSCFSKHFTLRIGDQDMDPAGFFFEPYILHMAIKLVLYHRISGNQASEKSLKSVNNLEGGDFERLRPLLSYPGANVFIICFSIDCAPSFENVTSKWLPELNKHAPGIPIMIVGTKLGLRTDPEMLKMLAKRDRYPVTTVQGKKLAKQGGAVGYTERSALTQRGLNDVFTMVGFGVPLNMTDELTLVFTLIPFLGAGGGTSPTKESKEVRLYPYVNSLITPF